MDKAERSRLLCLLIAESQHRVGSRIALYRGAAKALPSLIDALDAADREHDAAACKRNAYWRGLTAVLNGIDEGSVSLVDIRLIVVEALRSVEG